MSSRDAWTLFRIGGVPVRIHFSWILIAIYLSVMFTGQFWQLARAAEVAEVDLLLPPWAWGILLTLALFACVLLHELAHVTVAKRGGERVSSITLMMLGGVSEIHAFDRPRLERWMAAAGPMASLVLAAAFYGLFRASHGGPPDVRFGLFYLAQMNLVLGVFNLLPAFPMDGGRILRSFLVRDFGRLRATQIAATVGKVVAVGLLIAGVLGLGWWVALIAIFIFLAGDAESRQLQVQAALRGLRVREFYSPGVAEVRAESTVADAADAMLAKRAPVALVVADTPDRKPLGLVTATALAKLPVRERPTLPVTQLMSRALLITPEDELADVQRLLDEEGAEAAVVADQGQILGTLAREEIARALQLRQLAAARL